MRATARETCVSRRHVAQRQGPLKHPRTSREHFYRGAYEGPQIMTPLRVFRSSVMEFWYWSHSTSEFTEPISDLRVSGMLFWPRSPLRKFCYDIFKQIFALLVKWPISKRVFLTWTVRALLNVCIFYHGCTVEVCQTARFAMTRLKMCCFYYRIFVLKRKHITN